MTMIPVDWVGEKPEDAGDWERIIAECAKPIQGSGSVRIREAEGGWLIEAARKIPAFDFRWHVTEALTKAGKAVIGVDALQGGFPLSPEREAAIRASALERRETTPDRETASNQYDVQVVADLLGEIDRLRGKLQQAGLARDLTGQAAATLRDACDDVLPRSAGRRRKSADPRP
jgi:hypothetical protein